MYTIFKPGVVFLEIPEYGCLESPQTPCNNFTHGWFQLLHDVSRIIAYPEKWAHCEVVQMWIQMHFLSLVSTINNLVTTAMPRRQLSETEVARALAMLEAGLSQRRVAEMMVVSHSVISRANQRLRETGLYSERPRSGRPVSTTPR